MGGGEGQDFFKIFCDLDNTSSLCFSLVAPLPQEFKKVCYRAPLGSPITAKII